MKRSGVADLPLHGGRVPDWLAQRMTRLGAAITEAIIHDYGCPVEQVSVDEVFVDATESVGG